MNAQMPTPTNTVDTLVRKTIEEITGNIFADIRSESDLVEDLGISRAELVKIMRRIQDSLEIELSAEAKKEILEEAENVSDVVDVIAEEYEY